MIPVVDMVKTGLRIHYLRTQLNISVRDLQSIFNFNTPQAIYKWEQGRSLPTIDNLVILAKVFNVRLDDIICYG